MEYISAVKAAEKWSVSLRQVERLLAADRIPGAIKHGRVWLLPYDVSKPDDLRRKENIPPSSLDSVLSQLIAATSLPLPAHNPKGILNTVQEARVRRQYEGVLAYLRGDFAGVKRCFEQTVGDDVARLLASMVAIAAAISTGDYHTYTQIEAYLKGCIRGHPGSNIASMADLALCTAATGCLAPNMVSEWLKKGDLSAFPVQQRPFALYLRAKYFQCTRQYESMLAVAQTALALIEPTCGFSQNGLYLRLCCAVACHELEQEIEARHYLLEAMNLGLPHGFITPIAENVTTLGGLVEQCLAQEFPACYQAVLAQSERISANWAAFHNQFTKENITLILTLREYHIARLVAQRVPYAQIAEQHYISEGRVKNIVQDVYGKLYISNRKELAKYIL